MRVDITPLSNFLALFGRNAKSKLYGLGCTSVYIYFRGWYETGIKEDKDYDLPHDAAGDTGETGETSEGPSLSLSAAALVLGGLVVLGAAAYRMTSDEEGEENNAETERVAEKVGEEVFGAAEEPSEDEVFRAAVVFWKGEGCVQDRAEGLRLFKLAAERGNTPSMVHLGNCYIQDEVVPRDVEEGARWFQMAADAGDADGQCTLGQCYFLGQGRPQDSEEAVRWYRKAARASSNAQLLLARCYLHGQGAPQDTQAAVDLFRAAAEAGNAQAQAQLLRLQQEGFFDDK